MAEVRIDRCGSAGKLAERAALDLKVASFVVCFFGRSVWAACGTNILYIYTLRIAVYVYVIYTSFENHMHIIICDDSAP